MSRVTPLSPPRAVVATSLAGRSAKSDIHEALKPLNAENR